MAFVSKLHLKLEVKDRITLEYYEHLPFILSRIPINKGEKNSFVWFRIFPKYNFAY